LSFFAEIDGCAQGLCRRIHGVINNYYCKATKAESAVNLNFTILLEILVSWA